jgi:CRISPR-associated protein Cmr4
MSHSRLMVLHALTPLHVGAGRGEGLIDLPVARDIVTRHPIIPGSGVKGPLRSACADAETRTRVFGPDTNNAHEHASAVRFSDARLLALPIPSDYGTFAWVTSPMVLARFLRDAGPLMKARPSAPTVATDQARCAKDAALSHNGTLTLEGQRFKAQEDKEWPEALADLLFASGDPWRELFRRRLAIVADDVFDAFAETGTDVRAHIAIDPASGTVKAGALWYEESVPAESVFYSVVAFVASNKTDPATAERSLRDILCADLTFGGGKTTGMGVVRARLGA